ncbi:MAG: hypothetical protein ABII90_12205 [Bacteroidota bacterium]
MKPEIKKTLFYYGIDAVAKLSEQKYISEEKMTYTSGMSTDTWYKDENENSFYGFGAGPVVGVKFILNNSLSISTETRIDFISYQSKGTYKSSSYYYPVVTEDKFTSEGMQIIASPLGLFSLNVHF